MNASAVPVHLPGIAARFKFDTCSRFKLHNFQSPIIHLLRFADNHVLIFDGQLVLDASYDYRLSDNARRLVWPLYLPAATCGILPAVDERTGRVLPDRCMMSSRSSKVSGILSHYCKRREVGLIVTECLRIQGDVSSPRARSWQAWHDSERLVQV